MLTEYIQAALACTKWEVLSDGSFFGSIPGFPGVYGCCPKLDDSIKQLQESFEEWLLLGILRRCSVPEAGGINIPVRMALP